MQTSILVPEGLNRKRILVRGGLLGCALVLAIVVALLPPSSSGVACARIGYSGAGDALLRLGSDTLCNLEQPRRQATGYGPVSMVTFGLFGRTASMQIGSDVAPVDMHRTYQATIGFWKRNTCGELTPVFRWERTFASPMEWSVFLGGTPSGR